MRGVCPDFYFACTRETRATPQSHDDNDNGNDNCNENDNLCAIVHREVKPPQKRLAPAQTTFHAPFRPRARRNPTTPAWAGTHRTPTTFEWPRWRQAVFRRPRVRRGSLPARTCIPLLSGRPSQSNHSQHRLTSTCRLRCTSWRPASWSWTPATDDLAIVSSSSRANRARAAIPRRTPTVVDAFHRGCLPPST